jgi:hypothetical protein
MTVFPEISMTVGISLTKKSRLEAVVITDSRGSRYGRESDSRQKVSVFSFDKYHGVLFGSGSGNFIDAARKDLLNISEERLDDCVKEIHARHRRRVVEQFSADIMLRRQRVLGEAAAFSPSALIACAKAEADSLPEGLREKMLTGFTDRALGRFEGYITGQIEQELAAHRKFKSENYSELVLVAYDSSRGRVRQFYIDSRLDEIFMDRIEIGSGTDGADMYLSDVLRGVDTDKLKNHDLVFYAAKAFNSAEINTSVGGLPTIALVGANAVDILNTAQTCAIINLCGAQQADVYRALTEQGVKTCLLRIINSTTTDDSVYSLVSKILGLRKDVLTSCHIPYGSWREMVNKTRIY